MLQKERKRFLADVIVKFEEVEGWCKNLHSVEDVNYLRSKGFVGGRLLLILYLVIPVMWAIQIGFDGVPWLVSFLKRRLKRVRPQEKKDKTRKRKEHMKHQSSKPSIIRLKCCKTCESVKLRKLVDSRFKEEKVKAVEGSGLRTKRNYLRRLRKKVRKGVMRDVKVEVDDYYDPVMDYSQSTYRIRKGKILDRKVKRAKDIESGQKFISRNGLLPFLRSKSNYRFPGWMEAHFLHHYKIDHDKLTQDGVDVFDSLLHSSDGPVVYAFISQFTNKIQSTAQWVYLNARILNDKSLKNLYLTCSHSTSSKSSSYRRSKYQGY
jgi:hypothetical protein